jgi:perosamine synthetase
MLYTVKFTGGTVVRDRVAALAAERGIETRVYFPPAHRQPIFAGIDAHLPVTEDLAGSILSLPAHSKLTQTEIDDILLAVRDAVLPADSVPA